MQFDFESLDTQTRYKLLVSSIVPRPIAWVSSQNADGLVNLAPYSFFNAFSANPPILGIGMSNRDDRPAGTPKDSKSNIRALGQFVVNLVDEASAEAMNHSAIAFPEDQSEPERIGLATLASERVAPPRIAASPISFECVLHQEVVLGATSSLVLGRVVLMHVRDDLVSDPKRHHLATEAMAPIGRMHGGGMYSRTRDLFRLDRLSYADWQAERRG